MTRGRLRRLAEAALTAPASRVRRYYEEVHGARPAESVPEERVRQGLREACLELLEKPAKERT